MLAVILNMVDVDFVGGMHRQLTRNSDQGEVIGNQEAAKIKQHVVVRAQANQVVRRCRARRVGNPKVGYARPLRTVHPTPSNRIEQLAGVVITFLDRS